MDRLPFLVICVALLGACERQDVLSFLDAHKDTTQALREEPGRPGKVGSLVGWTTFLNARALTTTIAQNHTRALACPPGWGLPGHGQTIALRIETADSQGRTLRTWIQHIELDHASADSFRIEDTVSWETPERQGTRGHVLWGDGASLLIQDTAMPGRWASLPIKDDPLVMLRRTRQMLDHALRVTGPWRPPEHAFGLWIHDPLSKIYLGCESLPQTPPQPSPWEVQAASWLLEHDTGTLDATLYHTTERTTLNILGTWRVRPSTGSPEATVMPQASVVLEQRPWEWVTLQVDDLYAAGLLHLPGPHP